MHSVLTMQEQVAVLGIFRWSSQVKQVQLSEMGVQVQFT
jgi:hypothetical protein